MSRRLLVTLHAAIARRPLATVVLTCLLAAGASLGLGRARVDMSFRPLFADDLPEAEVTRAFEREFGQPSGEFVGAIVSPAGGDARDPAFLARLERAAERVAAVPHVAEVLTVGRRPEAAPRLLSADGRLTLVLARVDVPLDALETRRAIIESMDAELTAALDDATYRMVGVSVVETGYTRIVLLSLARSFALTTVALVLVLLLLFRHPGPVALTMAGASLATPASLGVMALIGQEITMVNSIVPLMIVVIGVADAVHMRGAFAGQARARPGPHGRAIRRMFVGMAWPCFLTTVTTVVGFLSLRAAEITAIRDFGLNVALGVGIAWLFNVMLVPALLHLVPATRAVRPRPGADRWIEAASTLVTRRPAVVCALFLLAAAIGVAGVGRLETNQRFNEEVDASHPLRADQALLEREFGGFLGPEVVIRRADGSPIDAGDAPRVAAFAATLAGLQGVHRVEGPIVGSSGAVALLVRTGDIGTRGARVLGAGIEGAAAADLGETMEAAIVGQWWLAQLGMRNIIRDMTSSFALSCLLVLPLVALALRSARLFLVSLLPNLLPMALALGFMGWAGISLRIGTAMVLAIALGIAVDDTIHLLVRLRRDGDVRASLRDVGPPMLYTSLALCAGFLSMLSNDLIAIRDMGVVGAFTIAVALLADLLLAPALHQLVPERTRAGYVIPATKLRRRMADGTQAGPVEWRQAR